LAAATAGIRVAANQEPRRMLVGNYTVWTIVGILLIIVLLAYLL
jgi:hypothetical protein